MILMILVHSPPQPSENLIHVISMSISVNAKIKYNSEHIHQKPRPSAINPAAPPPAINKTRPSANLMIQQGVLDVTVVAQIVVRCRDHIHLGSRSLVLSHGDVARIRGKHG